MIDLGHQFFQGGDETRLLIRYNETWFKIFRTSEPPSNLLIV